MPRHILPEVLDQRSAPDVQGLRRGVAAKELAVKHAEAKMKRDKDYRHVVRYLADSTALHDYERDARDYLIDELDIARARIDHYHAALELTQEHLGAMELKYDAVTATLVSKLAHRDAHLDLVEHRLFVDAPAHDEFVTQRLRALLSSEGPADGPLSSRDFHRLFKRRCWGEHSDDDDDETTTAKVRLAAAVRCVKDDVDIRTLVQLVTEKHEADVKATLDRTEALEAAFAAADLLAADAYAFAAAGSALLDEQRSVNRDLQAQLAAVTDHAAVEVARPRAELELYRTTLKKSVARSRRMEKQHDAVRDLLVSLLHVDSRVVQARAARVAVGLGILQNHESAREEIERWDMEREDVQNRTRLAILGPTPKVSKKKRLGASASRSKRRSRTGKKGAGGGKKKKKKGAAATGRGKSPKKGSSPGKSSSRASMGDSSPGKKTTTAKTRIAVASPKKPTVVVTDKKGVVKPSSKKKK